MKKTERAIVSFSGEELQKAMEYPAFNTKMMLFSGMEPKYLKKDEIELLKSEYGEDWFYVLGYTDEWEKPPA